jgi:hypothetical protein
MCYVELAGRCHCHTKRLGSGPALPAVPCRALPCPALPCPALPCPHYLSHVSTTGVFIIVSDVATIIIIIIIIIISLYFPLNYRRMKGCTFNIIIIIIIIIISCDLYRGYLQLHT